MASNIRQTFPSIQTFLMVRIGGGVPGKVDIRLSDVVVSAGGMQYNLGKTLQQGRFQPTGTVRQPLLTLVTAVSTLQAHQKLEISKIPVILPQIRKRYPIITEYTNREQLKDLLFNSAYEHSKSVASCNDCGISQLVYRSPRSNKARRFITESLRLATSSQGHYGKCP